MKRIHYAGGSLLTGDDLADALLSYAQALANSGKADSVFVPILLGDDSVVPATLLLGPASQIVCFSEPSAHEELVDVKLLADLRRRIAARVGAARTVTAEESEDQVDHDETHQLPEGE